MDTNTLLDELAQMIIRRARKRVAIDGIDTAGKTMLADALGARLRSQGHPVIRTSIDGFHNPREIRARRGGLSPEGYYEDSFDYPALKTALLDPLSEGGSRRYKTRLFDFRAEQALEAAEQIAEAGAILIFEGVFLQRPEIRAYWDFTIFVDIPFELALERACVRDVTLFGSIDVVKARYLKRYIPGQQLYFAQCHPKANADIVIDNRDPANPEILAIRDEK